MGRVRQELLIVLAVTFGMSGVRALFRLIDALASPTALSEQTVALNPTQSAFPWLDLALQLCSAATLFAWGGLALFLLAGDGIRLARSPRDLVWGAGLAALIGIPGLGFYVAAVHLGLSKQVIPAALTHPGWEIPILLVWSAANAFGEEIVVVAWLMTRLRQLRWSPWAAIAASAVLRGSYHLYQGVSAGVGNIIMGVIFGYVFYRTGRVWPLIVGHFLIDAVAFVGYAAVGGDLSWLGL